MNPRTLPIAATALLLALAWVPECAAQKPGPRVRSRTAADQERKSAPGDFLDSRDASPSAYEQVSFFGQKASGKVFVFVIDCSGSMGDGRLARAKSELRRTIASMRFPQQYLVIFYNDLARVMPGGVPRSGDATSTARLEAWMSTVEAFGGTDPRSAMRTALGIHPDAIFLLTDGEYPRGSAESINGQNTGPVPVHCIDLGDGSGAASLRAIATHSGGTYAGR
ncbi:MAG: vWA domain-containing protein [Isosphaeraceae bacterium]